MEGIKKNFSLLVSIDKTLTGPGLGPLLSKEDGK